MCQGGLIKINTEFCTQLFQRPVELKFLSSAPRSVVVRILVPLASVATEQTNTTIPANQGYVGSGMLPCNGFEPSQTQPRPIMHD